MNSANQSNRSQKFFTVSFITPGVRYWISEKTAASFKAQYLLDEDAGGEQMLPDEIYSVTFTVLLGQ